jgi:hypothetical protein
MVFEQLDRAREYRSRSGPCLQEVVITANKGLKLVLVAIAIVCMIPMVSAEIINLGFESGDLTGWEHPYDGMDGNYSYQFDVVSQAAHTGNYGLRLETKSLYPSSDDYVDLYAYSPLANNYNNNAYNNTNYFSFWYKIESFNYTGNGNTQFNINFECADDVSGSYNVFNIIDIEQTVGWTEVKSDLNGLQCPTGYYFYLEQYTDTNASLLVYYDDFVVSNEGEPTPTPTPAPTPTPTPTLPPYNPCVNQTGNITIDLAAATTTSLIWYWDESVNLTKVALDGKNKNSFDLDESSYTGTGFDPGTWHRLKIYNATDYGMLNCTTNPENKIVTIPVMPSTENDGWLKAGNWWILAVGLIGVVVVFKKW